jgi:hypothetical protein
MIRVLVMANDSVVADSIASTLAAEIDLDVVRMTRRELGQGDHFSVVILVDEEEEENESIQFSDLLRDDVTLLLIRLSLKSRNIFVYESYQINNPTLERLIHLVKYFGRANLKKKVYEKVNYHARPKNTRLLPLQIYPDAVPRES